MMQKNADSILELARAFSKSLPSTSTESHSRVHFKWTPVPFHGKSGEWCSWWQTFSSAVHNDKTLGNEWKIKLLCECLKGKAEDVLGQMERTSDNYERAIQLIQNRFGDPLVLSRAYYEQLEQLPAATNLKTQRQTLDKLAAILRNLEALRDKLPIDDSAIAKSICRKFPQEVLRWALSDIQKTHADMIFLPMDLLVSLEKIMKEDDYMARQLADGDSPSASVKPAGVLASAQKRMAPTSEGPLKKSQSCIFCSRMHFSPDCRLYPTIEARRNRLAELKCCINCMVLHHQAKTCRRPAAVCERCHKNHHTALCIMSVYKKSKRGKLIFYNDSFLQTFVCMAYNHAKTKTVEVRGLLDPGSQHSFISLDLARLLELSFGKIIKLECGTFSESNPSLINGYHVIVTLKNNHDIEQSIRLITTPCITGMIKTAPSPEETARILDQPLEYADYDIFDYTQRQIKILIGADIYYSLVNVKNSYNLPCGVTMLHSFFGWIPAGGVKVSVKTDENYCGAMVVSTKNDLYNKNTPLDTGTETFSSNSGSVDQYILADSNLMRLWSLETLGIESPEKNDKKGADYVVEYYKKTTYIDNLGRKNIRIPWIDIKTYLPTNFRVALARLKNLVEKTPKPALQLGDNHFRQQQEEGIIEDALPIKSKLCSQNTGDEKVRVHYLPHRWLFKKDKIRVVNDASAPTKTGLSLNKIIYQGCNLTTDIVQLLLNFRLYQIALMADIEKAFLQISLNEVDRDACRFLWIKNINKPVTEDNLVYKRFARLPMGLNVSPCILNLVLADVFSEPPQNKWLLDGQNKFYADNLINSVSTQNDALEVFEAMTSRLKSIKMNLRDWSTNDATVASALPNTSLDSNKGPTSALGIQWCRMKDSLSIKLDNEKPLLGTKRNVLKFLASIYDPLGLIAPCILDLKLFVQKCWKNKYEWNTILPPQLNAEWLKLRSEALKIPNICISRHYFQNSNSGIYTLHIFCDASIKAYACCAYLVYRDEINLSTSSRLIFSKIRISPTNNMTIPKLELMAVLIGKRVALYLKESLVINIQKTTLWTDATTILQWLQSREVLPPFVKNRITEIQQAKNIFIRYVATSDNPADCASRGQSVMLLERNNLWWYGPSWLTQERLWPKPPINVENYDSSSPHLSSVILLIGTKASFSFLTENLEKNFNTWSARIRVLFHIIKFCFLGGKLPFYATETQALNMAERLLIIELQRKYYSKEYELLRKGEYPKNNLDLFLDDKQIIRCKGRLHFTRFPWETVHPILLPRESPAIISLIKEIHEQNAHIGVSHTLAKIREKYWICKGRAKVKSALHSCFRCRYWLGGSYPLPPIPPLPEARLTDVIPFLQIGIDYFGPLHIKNHHDEIFDVQVLIFTCLVTRAIHLELVPDQSGEQFIMALDRFCSLKRVPKLIISDNGKTFVFIQPLVGIKVLIRDVKINCFLTSNRIEWYFIPQYAPWFGGAYERLIAIIKKCLKISYGKTYLTYMELQTVLYKIADILNGRPLSYISEEIVEPLTPNHFLKLGPTNINTSMDPYPKPPLSDTGLSLMKKWALLNRILESYWDAFRHLYLLSLRERHTTHHKEKKGVSRFQPRVGDVVLVEEVSMPRAYWKLGRIEKLDVRGAVAYVRHNKGLLLRSIRRLYPLETQCETSRIASVAPSN